MKHTYKALLIDFDGTLVKNHNQFYAIYTEFALKYNFIPSVDEYDNLNGKPLKECLAILKKKHFINTDLDLLLKNYMEKVNSISDVYSNDSKKLLNLCYEKKIKTAIVSSSPKKRILEWINQHSLHQHIQCIISSDDVNKGKPSPEPYLKALCSLDVNAYQAIAIEDSINGLISSSQANIHTAFLGTHKNLNIDSNKYFFINSLIDLEEYIS